MDNSPSGKPISTYCTHYSNVVDGVSVVSDADADNSEVFSPGLDDDVPDVQSQQSVGGVSVVSVADAALSQPIAGGVSSRCSLAH